MTFKPDKEPFLARWSKRKHEARADEAREKPKAEAPAAQVPGAEKNQDSQSPLPELPPIAKLDYDSDYRAFLDPRVDEDTRRSALKKLFADARFNVIDQMDVYIDDYTKSDPIPAAMLASLQQARNILEWAKGDDRKSVRETGDSTGEQATREDSPSDGDERPAPTGPDVPARTAKDDPERDETSQSAGGADDDSRRDA